MSGRYDLGVWGNAYRSVAVALVVVVLAGCGGSGTETVTDARSENGLAYDLEGAGPIIVLIHGSNLDRRLWDAEMEWLPQRARVLRYDLRGHGSSNFPRAAFANHEELIELLDEIDEDEVTIVGLSFGAHVAVDVALEAPDTVDRLVLVSPSLQGFVPDEIPPFFADLGAALRDRDFAQANEVLLASPLLAVPPEAQDRVRTMVTENEKMWTIPFQLLQTGSPPALSRLEDVSAPTLILVGDTDLAAVRAQGELLESQLPDAKLVTVAGGRHLLNLSSPDEFRESVTTFLDEKR